MSRIISLLFTLFIFTFSEKSFANSYSGEEGWVNYVNVLYKYQICYPGNILKGQGETDNSSGQIFSNPNGGKVGVFGEYESDTTLEEYINQESLSYTNKNGREIYKIIKKNWGVVSGYTDEGKIFYSKVYKYGEKFIVMQITYPRAYSSIYDGLSAKMSACFRVEK